MTTIRKVIKQEFEGRDRFYSVAEIENVIRKQIPDVLTDSIRHILRRIAEDNKSELIVRQDGGFKFYQFVKVNIRCAGAPVKTKKHVDQYFSQNDLNAIARMNKLNQLMGPSC